MTLEHLFSPLVRVYHARTKRALPMLQDHSLFEKVQTVLSLFDQWAHVGGTVWLSQMHPEIFGTPDQLLQPCSPEC